MVSDYYLDWENAKLSEMDKPLSNAMFGFRRQQVV
jgi:hypothetical protein